MATRICEEWVLFQPLSDDRWVRVNTHEFRPPGTVVGELVRNAGWRDDDVAWFGVVASLTKLEGQVSLLYYPRLVIGVPV